jgi:hypothetical protein
MLIEADPHACSEIDASCGYWNAGDNPVRLLNWAWQIQWDNSVDYQEWEASQIRAFLNSPQVSPEKDIKE